MNEPTPRPDICLNCGASGLGRYCAECGQENTSTLISFRSLVGQFLDDFLSLDSTFFRSLMALAIKPGHLSLEYSRGRRRHFASPIRIYLIASVSFFLIASFMVGRSTRGGDPQSGTSPAGMDSTGAGRDGQTGGGVGWTRWIPLPDSVSVAIDQELADQGPLRFELDESELRAIGEGDTVAIPTWMARRLKLPSLPDSVRAALEEMDPNSLESGVPGGGSNTTVSMFGKKYDVDQMQLLGEIFSITPKMLFVLFPIFALLLQLIYIRRKRYYVEHLVFSLHCHAFLFLVLTLVVLLQRGQLVLFALPLIALYVYLAMKRFYGQGWFKTALKFAILSGGYFFLVMVVAMLTLVASIWVITGFQPPG